MAKDLPTVTDFHEKNTVEITLAGKKRRVNKFEAKALKEKLAKNKAKDSK